MDTALPIQENSYDIESIRGDFPILSEKINLEVKNYHNHSVFVLSEFKVFVVPLVESNVTGELAVPLFLNHNKSPKDICITKAEKHTHCIYNPLCWKL